MDSIQLSSHTDRYDTVVNHNQTVPLVRIHIDSVQGTIRLGARCVFCLTYTILFVAVYQFDEHECLYLDIQPRGTLVNQIQVWA